MVCTKCNAQNDDTNKFCQICGALLEHTELPHEQVSEAEKETEQEVQTSFQQSETEPKHTASPNTVPPRAEYRASQNGGRPSAHENMVYRVPPMPNVYPPIPPKPFTWGDICTVTGFVASIFGIFWFSVILCPIGLGLSIAGFLRNRTKGLAVAGIVVSFISIIIKIGYILYTSNILPDWLISGVFG